MEIDLDEYLNDAAGEDDDDDDAESPDGDEEKGQEGAAPAGEGDPAAEAKPDEELTEEDLAKIQANPEALGKLLDSEIGKAKLNELVNEVLSPEKLEEQVTALADKRERDKADQQTREEKLAAFKDALTEAKQGDFTKLGELMLPVIEKQMTEQPIREQVAQELGKQTLAELRGILDGQIAMHGLEDAAASLTTEEQRALQMANFEDRGKWLNTVLSKLHERKAELVKPARDAKAEAAKHEATAEKARAASARAVVMGGGRPEDPTAKKGKARTAREELRAGLDDDDD